MTKSQLTKAIKELKSKQSKYMKYNITTDLDSCNDGVIFINLNYYDIDNDEYIDAIEYKCWEYETDEEYEIALSKAEKAYSKLVELCKELNIEQEKLNKYYE
jgi:hypothetical protein